MKLEITTNAEHIIKIRDALIKNNGFCPCQLEKSERTKCVCLNFIEETPVGEWCHCGLYKKVED